MLRLRWLSFFKVSKDSSDPNCPRPTFQRRHLLTKTSNLGSNLGKVPNFAPPSENKKICQGFYFMIFRFGDTNKLGRQLCKITKSNIKLLSGNSLLLKRTSLHFLDRNRRIWPLKVRFNFRFQHFCRYLKNVLLLSL